MKKSSITYYLSDDLLAEFNNDYIKLVNIIEDIIDEDDSPYNFLESSILEIDECIIMLS